MQNTNTHSLCTYAKRQRARRSALRQCQTRQRLVAHFARMACVGSLMLSKVAATLNNDIRSPKVMMRSHRGLETTGEWHDRIHFDLRLRQFDGTGKYPRAAAAVSLLAVHRQLSRPDQCRDGQADDEAGRASDRRDLWLWGRAVFHRV